MTRAQFEHAIRAAGAVVGENDVIVIGSQAIHAWINREIPKRRLAWETGVSLWEVIAYACARKVTAQYDIEDPLHDVETIRR
jgi:hypothetical protein